ncbi:endonuclease III [Corynebacterium choanae]|uniref:endonuclease III n=1 Tax=Corynebacterium choanae TaxID=1862358 RepID=UPI0013DE071B|nr:endonuclease III [Corynebacterium choanae]
MSSQQHRSSDEPETTAPAGSEQQRRTAIVDRLSELYPEATCDLVFTNPFELLIATVLSAQTTDIRVNSVTPALFAAYPTPVELAGAHQTDVETIIRPLGLYRNKAAAIIALSAELLDKHQGQVPADRVALEALPGVGRKTANVVLPNGFGIPGFAVDTHVSRVAQRLGLVTTTTPTAIERELCTLVPETRWGQLSHELIWHGRTVCHAKRPACAACGLATWCPQSTTLGEQDHHIALQHVTGPHAQDYLRHLQQLS